MAGIRKINLTASGGTSMKMAEKKLRVDLKWNPLWLLEVLLENGNLKSEGILRGNSKRVIGNSITKTTEKKVTANM